MTLVLRENGVFNRNWVVWARVNLCLGVLTKKKLHIDGYLRKRKGKYGKQKAINLSHLKISCISKVKQKKTNTKKPAFFFQEGKKKKKIFAGARTLVTSGSINELFEGIIVFPDNQEGWGKFLIKQRLGLSISLIFFGKASTLSKKKN